MSPGRTDPPSRYAQVERELRFRLPGLPDVPDGSRVLHVVDRYVHGTGLRLRRVEEVGREPLLKLGQKVRLDPASPAVVAHTTMYLTPTEHDALAALPARTLHKTRHLVPTGDGRHVAVDVFGGALLGLLTAEIDLGGGLADPQGRAARDALVDLLPAGAVEVTFDERYTGGALADADRPPPWPAARVTDAGSPSSHDDPLATVAGHDGCPQPDVTR